MWLMPKFWKIANKTYSMGWRSPIVYIPMAIGIALLILFIFVERRSRDPMFRLSLLKLVLYIRHGHPIIILSTDFYPFLVSPAPSP